MDEDEAKDEIELKKDMEEKYYQIMKDIRVARKLAHMSQTELGEIVGFSTTTISRFEHGIATPSADTLKLMLGALANELLEMKKTTITIKEYGKEDVVLKGDVYILCIGDEYMQDTVSTAKGNYADCCKLLTKTAYQIENVSKEKGE